VSEPDQTEPLPGETSVDEVVLRAGSAGDLADFYERVVGLSADRGDGVVRLSADGDEPLVTLRVEPDAPERPADAAGLYHFALRVPDRPALGAALRHIRDEGYSLDGVADHVASEALYLSDPEGNGIEIYNDRPREEWEYMNDGQVRLSGDPLDLGPIEAAAPDEIPDGIHPETDMGHVHLEVTDLERSSAFYREGLGFNLRLRKPRAVFLAGGAYHHHLAINTRMGRTRAYQPDALGVETVEFRVPRAAFEDVRARLRERDADVRDRDRGLEIADPDGIRIVMTPLE